MFVQHDIKKFGDRERSQTPVGETSMTQQNMLQETDVNYILKKYEKQQILTHVNNYMGDYGDFSDVPDYKTGLERLMAAQDMFMSLPAVIRDRFGNDPGKYIEFATNPENLPELRKMGLAPPEAEAPKPQLVQVVEPPEGGKPPSKKPKPEQGDQ